MPKKQGSLIKQVDFTLHLGMPGSGITAGSPGDFTLHLGMPGSGITAASPGDSGAGDSSVDITGRFALFTLDARLFSNPILVCKELLKTVPGESLGSLGCAT